MQNEIQISFILLVAADGSPLCDNDGTIIQTNYYTRGYEFLFTLVFERD